MDDEGDGTDFRQACCWLSPRLQTPSLTSSQPTHLNVCVCMYTCVLEMLRLYVLESQIDRRRERECSVSAYTLNKPMKIHKDLATPTHKY